MPVGYHVVHCRRSDLSRTSRRVPSGHCVWDSVRFSTRSEIFLFSDSFGVIDQWLLLVPPLAAPSPVTEYEIFLILFFTFTVILYCIINMHLKNVQYFRVALQPITSVSPFLYVA